MPRSGAEWNPRSGWPAHRYRAASDFLAASTSAASNSRACFTAASARCRAAATAAASRSCSCLVEAFLGAVQLGLRRLQGRFVLRGLGSRLFQALLGEFARALGGFVARVQHLLERLEENALQIKVQQDHQQKGRHCSQQYSAQGVQHGIHDVRKGRPRRIA